MFVVVRLCCLFMLLVVGCTLRVAVRCCYLLLVVVERCALFVAGYCGCRRSLFVVCYVSFVVAVCVLSFCCLVDC